MGEMFTATFDVTDDDQRAYSQFLRHEHRRKRLVSVACGSLLFPAMLVFVPLRLRVTWTPWWFAALPIASGLCWWLALEIRDGLREARRFSPGGCQMVFSPEGFTHSANNMTTRQVSWSEVEYVAELPDYLYIQCPALALAYWIPRRGFRSPAAYRALWASMTEWSQCVQATEGGRAG